MSKVLDAGVRLESEDIKKLLINYATPAIVGMIVMSLYNIVDRIFIGQGVGPLAISGLALTFPLMSLIAAIGTLIGVGSASRMSIVLGMKDVKWARNILGNAFILTFVLSSVLVAVSMMFMDQILVAFGGSEATIPYAKAYLMIVVPGSVLTNITYSFSNMMRASGFPKKSMYAILIGVCTNVILDPIFIFGLDMGIRGAAIATVISMFLSAVFVVVHFFNPKHPVHFANGCLRIKWRIVRNIVSIGMAPFLMNTAASMVNIILNNRLVKYGGDLAIGAYGVIGSYAILIIMCVIGLGQGMQPIVGYNYGAGKYKRMKDALLLTMKISFFIMTGGFILSECFTPYLVSAFTTDPELSAMAVHGMRLAVLMMPVIGFQIIISTFFQSISKAPKAIFISLSRQVIFLIPILYIFSDLWGLTGIWLSLPVADFLSSVVAILFLIGERKIFYPRFSRKA